MPPAEPAPDFNVRLLDKPQRRTEEGTEYDQWKAVADELKEAGYPTNLGASVGVDSFSDQLRKKARQLDQQIEKLITPLLSHNPAHVDEAIMTLRTAICQGMTKEKFEKLMSDHNFSLKCNVIWESDAIAYRCNTCSKTPCMSLCLNCFKGGNHEGHDVTRFFSREGGACDCGNEDVLKEPGFCTKHGKHAERPPPPPATIVSLSELILFRVLMVVLDHFRKQKHHQLFDVVPRYMLLPNVDQVCGAGKLIALLQECVDYGGPIRDAFARILIDREIYSSIWAVPSEDILDNYSTKSFREFREKHKWFEQNSREAMGHEMLPEYFSDFPKEKMKNTCFLHELLFWMRVHIFPQSLINLTLVFLGDTEYRDEFARRFFLLYPWTSESMKDACSYEGMDYRSISMASSRIIHISVQMLSSSALCSRLTDEINLPRLMFGSVSFLLLSGELKSVPIRPLGPRRRPSPSVESDLRRDMYPPDLRAAMDAVMRAAVNELEAGEDAMEIVMEADEQVEDVPLLEAEEPEAIPWRQQALPFASPDEEPRNNRPEASQVEEWYTVDVEKSKVLSNHGYWFAMGDTQNLLSHPEVVSKMCRDEKTMKTYFSVIEKMHCMDAISRIARGDHLPNERNDDYQRTLVLEYEMSASSMFNLVFGIVANGDDEAAAAFYDCCWESCKRWFQKMDLEHAGKPLQLGKSSVTFHLPLTRHLSTLLAYAHTLTSVRDRLNYLTKHENKELLHVMMLHPLRIQAARSEWAAGMWVRNGQQMRIPACLYTQTHMLFSYYMPDLDLLRLCAANLEAVEVIHSLFDSFSLGDVFKFKVESGPPFSGVLFSPIRARSLARIEWVDTLVFGCLRLIADVVLLPGVCEQTNEESMRDDIVCKLAIQEMPHSRLRQQMAEKGSHGAELVDEFFEKILAEVAVFSDPEKDESLDQGVYSLSNEAQIHHLCPLLVMGRSTSQRHAASAMQRLEIIERRMAGRPEHQFKNVWTPYRLPNMEKAMERRSEFVMGVYQLIINERLLETYCYILGKYKEDSDELERRLSGAAPSAVPHEFIFKEQTVQLVIYLLSAALLYMKTQPEGDVWRKRIHEDLKDLSDPESPERTLAISVLSIGSVLMSMNMKRGEISKKEEEKRVREMMREAVKGEIKDRIIAGTPSEYYGRLLAILYRDDNRFREMLDERYPEVVEAKMEVEEQVPKDDTPNLLIAKKRAAAEALRRRIMEDKKKQGEEMMKKLMEAEQMTQEDLDSLDVSDKTVEQYECPICGDETPASFDQPIGLLVYVQFNGSYLNSIDASVEDKSLIELDEELQKDGEAAKLRYQKHARFWRDINSEVEHMVAGDHSDLISTPSMVELKTCGHHAHISCLSQYRETIFNQRDQREGRYEVVYCPKCRFPTNGLLPLKVGTGVEVNMGESLKNGDSEGRLVVFDTLIKQLNQMKKTTLNVDEYEAESPSTLYSHSSIRHLVENNISTRGWDTEEFLKKRTHVFLQGLLMQNIDRSIFFDEIGVSPVRPKCIDLVTEHLNFHSALSLNNEELDLTMAHVRELLMEDPKELYEEPLMETDPMEGPSGLGGGGGDEKTAPGLSDEEMAILYPPKKAEDPDLSLDMQCALTSPSLSNDDRWKMFHLGIPHDEQGVNKLTRLRVRFSEDWKKRCKEGRVLDYDYRLPSLFCRPLSLATRMTSVMMSTELTKESMLESLRLVVRRLIVLAAVRWTVQICSRADYGRLREWAEEGGEREGRGMDRPRYLMGIRRVVARVFCSHPIIASMAKSLERSELPDFDESVMKPVHDLLTRIAQLWNEVRVMALPEGVKSARGMTREEVERHVLGATGIGVLPTYFVIAQWTLNAIKPLEYILQKKRMVMEEPCSYRPFLTLRLPEFYDDIFARYFGRTCRRCCKVPQNPMICLICSEMICLDSCCSGPMQSGETYLEPETHPCGVHLPFLALNSALIVLVKLKVDGLHPTCRASIWGSVYLDAHGEEDRNLRRGKPLKLAQKRVERLYRDFLEGDVESRSRVYSIHHLSIALRDSHYNFQ
ncbi:hypothetical protein PMAYCL1PPCAC_06426 [Pristionchus mayeri]|uniref:E3 ubiquitin-protein ligase n=1 Tax=Pristionchus mayeri TaxID=1317129 RepID=A0AAN5CCF5_9BILA|nr:hypothetical protein PMAYCL1PPCAC_06426 [Pristionchus mayeri]